MARLSSPRSRSLHYLTRPRVGLGSSLALAYLTLSLPSTTLTDTGSIQTIQVNMSDQPVAETTPLLDPEVRSPGGSNGLANRAWAFRIATTASLIAGVLTLILLAVCMGLLSRSPPTYSTPYEIYYTFAPIAGFVGAATPSLRCRTEISLWLIPRHC